jgi:A/G-specific adenine glycosylase
MDFGAVVCKPASPICEACVFKKYCVAFLNNKINELPVKKKKITIKKRWFYYLVLEYKNTIAIHQRNNKDIWQGLYEFPLVEANKETGIKNILQQAQKNKLLLKGQYKLVSISPIYKQQLSHQLIAGQFIKIQLKKKILLKDYWKWVMKNRIRKYPFPQFINQFLWKKP